MGAVFRAPLSLFHSLFALLPAFPLVFFFFGHHPPQEEWGVFHRRGDEQLQSRLLERGWGDGLRGEKEKRRRGRIKEGERMSRGKRKEENRGEWESDGEKKR